jgi:chitin disaccharide deacetylase
MATMPDRLLLITADDFGIGPETSRGILEAARRGAITSSVVLVNSPFAADAVREWKSAGCPVELGWHPCLTLDAPILPPTRVPSLVGPAGRFHSLGRFLKRVMLGRINGMEVQAEFRAQFDRFVDLVGYAPVNVNAHHHIHVFRVVVDALARVLSEEMARPFVRRVVESSSTLWGISKARLKRSFLTYLGRSAAARQAAFGFPGSQALLGVSDAQHVSDPNFFIRWLSSSSGELVELACHPGYPDPTLLNRDEDPFHRRPNELELLLAPEFLPAVQSAGFRLVNAAEMSEVAVRKVPVTTRSQRATVGVVQMKLPGLLTPEANLHRLPPLSKPC